MVVKGKKLTQKDYLNKLKEELRSLETPRDKLEHLWEYYKWIPAVFLGFIAIISMIIAAIISLNTETIVAGAIINVPVSPEGYSMLQDGYYARAHTEGKRQRVELTNMNFVDPYSTVQQTYSMDIMENVTAMIGADLLDYVIYDEVALPYFMTPEAFADLRQLFQRRGEHRVQRAVMLHQAMGQFVGIPAGDGIKEQQFQRLVIGKGIQPAIQKAPAQFFAVSVMYAHTIASPGVFPAAERSLRPVFL